MDEILIEEKKYISSKQAAKVTGYAKDYVGQLCREGRVPARLVGRSWYVLESAVHDHRFGNPKEMPPEEVKIVPESRSTWESPRYEASEAEILPSVNRLYDKREPLEPMDNDSEVAQRMQETWQAWFDRFEQPVAAVEEEVETVAPEEEGTTEEIGVVPTESVGEEEESIPIRAIHHMPYQPTPREFMPVSMDIEARIPAQEEETDSEDELMDEEEEIEVNKKGGRSILRVVRVGGVVIAVIMVSLAALGSGYLDEFIISNEQVGLVAGVGLYSK
jgi:hypothetical protein